MAKLCCFLLAIEYLGVDAAYFIFAQTIDSLRDVAHLLRAGVPVLLDEVDKAKDDCQLIFNSVSMWKGILQGANPSQCRARNNDVKFAPRHSKFVTCNSNSLDDWISNMFQDPSPVDVTAIKLRSAECLVTERIFKHSSPPEGAVVYTEQCVDLDGAFEAAESLLK